MKNASSSIIDDFLVIVLGNANNRDQVMSGDIEKYKTQETVEFRYKSIPGRTDITELKQMVAGTEDEAFYRRLIVLSSAYLVDSTIGLSVRDSYNEIPAGIVPTHPVSCRNRTSLLLIIKYVWKLILIRI